MPLDREAGVRVKRASLSAVAFRYLRFASCRAIGYGLFLSSDATPSLSRLNHAEYNHS